MILSLNPSQEVGNRNTRILGHNSSQEVGIQGYSVLILGRR